MKKKVFKNAGTYACGILVLVCAACAFLGCNPEGATVISVTVSPATPTVAKGATRQFGATVIGTGSPAQTVTWAVTGIAGTATSSISASGLLTVPADETVVLLLVVATSTVDTTKLGTAMVFIGSTAPISVTVSPTTVSVAKGTTKPFTAQVNGSTVPAQAFTWTVTGVGGTAKSSISTSGLLTVPANETVNSLTVQATLIADTTKSGTATVTVTDPTNTGSSLGTSFTKTFTGVEKIGGGTFSAITFTHADLFLISDLLANASDGAVMLAANGTFTLKLGEVKEEMLDEHFFGDDGLNKTPGLAMIEILGFSDGSNNLISWIGGYNEYYGNVKYDGLISLIYANKDGNVTGHLTNLGDPFDYTINLTLKKGWNTAISTLTMWTWTIETGAPDDYKWFLHSIGP
jgi:hypothetical protein